MQRIDFPTRNAFRAMFAVLLACAVACSPSSPQSGNSNPHNSPADDAGSHTHDAGALLPDAGNHTPDAGGTMASDAGHDSPDAGQNVGDDAGVTSNWERLLHADGTSLVHVDGSPVDFRGAISCCGGGYGWPLFDESFADHVRGYDVNFLHMRLGPFLTGPNGESDWAGVGGGYVEVDGRADLTRFNETFWTRVRELIAYARSVGMYVEVDVADGWAIKHCRWGDISGYSAWQGDFNVQNEDWCNGAGSESVGVQTVWDHWVRKVVRETGRFDNVIYQDGNEIGLVPNRNNVWTTSMANIIRSEEAVNGYGRHLFGTQNELHDTIALDEVDFGELHGDEAAGIDACGGKPCLVNEYNPDPPLTPTELWEQYCSARGQGTYFWYWRHGQSASDMDETLALIAGGCD